MFMAVQSMDTVGSESHSGHNYSPRKDPRFKERSSNPPTPIFPVATQKFPLKRGIDWK